MASIISKITSGLTIVILAALILFYLVAGEAIRQAAPYVVWITVGGIVVAGGIRLWYLFDAHRLQNKAIRAETANAVVQNRLDSERTAWELQRDRMFTEMALLQMGGGLIHPETLGDKPTIRAFPVSTARQAEKVLPSGETAGVLLDALGNLQNILVVGGKGTGKTTLIQWLEFLRQESGKTIVLDSHAQPSQWVGHVVGQGREYKNIQQAMVGLVHKLNQRYERWGKGESGFEPIHTFIDEFTLLPKVMKGIGYNVQDYSVPMLTEGRKVSINCVWGVHSDRAAYLGLEGAADLVECFDAVVHLKNTNEGRYALVDFGEGKQDIRYQLPGPFKPQPRQIETTVATEEQPQPSIFDLPVASESEPDESDIETKQRIISLYDNGLSATKISEEVYGYKNKLKLDYIRDVLQEAGRLKPGDSD